jgi:hypothetical protein
MALTPQAMLDAFELHSEFEMACDLSRTMDTVAADPVYELWPRGYQIHGRSAVEELYRRLMQGFVSRIRDGARLTQTFGEQAAVFEDDVVLAGPGGEPVTVRISSVVAFDGEGRIQSERLYADDRLAAILDAALGDDILDVPGVTRVHARATRATTGSGWRLSP